MELLVSDHLEVVVAKLLVVSVRHHVVRAEDLQAERLHCGVDDILHLVDQFMPLVFNQDFEHAHLGDALAQLLLEGLLPLLILFVLEKDDEFVARFDVVLHGHLQLVVLLLLLGQLDVREDRVDVDL